MSFCLVVGNRARSTGKLIHEAALVRGKDDADLLREGLR